MDCALRSCVVEVRLFHKLAREINNGLTEVQSEQDLLNVLKASTTTALDKARIHKRAEAYRVDIGAGATLPALANQSADSGEGGCLGQLAVTRRPSQHQR